MTNQTIPPCPVCGKVPEINEEKIYCNCPHNCGEYKTRIDVVQTCDCEHFCYPIYPANAGNSLYTWVDTVETLLGRACRELGIETVEQLKARLAPDPRVAVLAADHTGMRISASGVLRATYPTREMYKHLKEMAARYYAGEISVVDEFLQLYALADDRHKLIAAQRGEG